MERTIIILILAHLSYYLYLQLISDMYRKGHSTQCHHTEILRLRNKYDVLVKTFKKNSNIYGFAWFRSIYLNEKLLTTKSKGKKDAYYALKWTFFHELYHFENKHKLKILLGRVLYSFTPLFLLLSWMVFVPVYVIGAYLLHVQTQHYEKMANDSARKKMNDEVQD